MSSTENSVLRRSMLLTFCMPALMIGFMHAPEGQLQGIYAKHAGLSLASLAAAMLLTRLFDAVTYPLIGFLSDRTFRKTGSRKLWMGVGSAVTVVGILFLYRPPPEVSIRYFTAWMMVTYVGWKLTEIPYGAWCLNLSGEYVQRARIQLWRAMALLIGTLMFYLVPFIAKATGAAGTTEMNFETLGLTAIVVAAVVPLLNLFALATVPDGEASAPRQSVALGLGEFRSSVRAMIRNRPLIHLLAAYFPTVIFPGMAAGVTYLYVDTYMGLGKQLPLILAASVPCTLIGVPFWGWIGMKFERHRVMAISVFLAALFNVAMGFVPIGDSALPFLMTLYSASVFCLISAGVLVPAMMGDILDYDRLQSGENRAGIFSAILAFLGKSVGGVSAAAGIAVVGWFNFDATATTQTAEAAFGIRLVSFWLPALGLAFGAALVWKFPIDRARQAEIREALKKLGSVLPV